MDDMGLLFGKALRNRNKTFAIWAKLLIECVQSYGTLASASKKYYRGRDKEFVFKKFIGRCYVPLSTTINVCIVYKVMHRFSHITVHLIANNIIII